MTVSLKRSNDDKNTNAKYSEAASGDNSSLHSDQLGESLGTWTDYTPTGALDIEVTLQLVVNR